MTIAVSCIWFSIFTRGVLVWYWCYRSIYTSFFCYMFPYLRSLEKYSALALFRGCVQLQFHRRHHKWQYQELLIKQCCFTVCLWSFCSSAEGLVQGFLRTAYSQQHRATEHHVSARTHTNTHTFWRSNWPHAHIASPSSSGQCSSSLGTAALHGDVSICHSLIGCWCSGVNDL